MRSVTEIVVATNTTSSFNPKGSAEILPTNIAVQVKERENIQKIIIFTYKLCIVINIIITSFEKTDIKNGFSMLENPKVERMGEK